MPQLICIYLNSQYLVSFTSNQQVTLKKIFSKLCYFVLLMSAVFLWLHLFVYCVFSFLVLLV